MSRWYVLQTKPHKEKAVAGLLDALRLDPFLPRVVERVRAGARMQRRVAPMFPSYLFVSVDLERWGKVIRYAPGVRDFLRCEGAPALVAEEVIEGIRDRVGPTSVFVPPPRHFAPGEPLTITSGPLGGLSVIFERELSGAERVAVLLAEVALPARVVLSAEVLARA